MEFDEKTRTEPKKTKKIKKFVAFHRTMGINQTIRIGKTNLRVRNNNF